MEPTFQQDAQHWPKWKLYGFRFVFLVLLLFIIPLDWKFYQKLFSIDWAAAPFYDLLTLTKYQPQFFAPARPWGQYLEFVSFWNWLIVALIALVGAAIWSVADKQRQSYPQLYYWSRVLVRYRLALGLIAYGIYKAFQLQLPYPPLSNLLTNYGDFYSWKIYYQTTGISPKYETFLGVVEILAGFLLLYRRTVTFGAGLIIGFMGNIVAVNFYYGLGEQSYSLLLVLFAVYLFAQDVPRLYQLLVSEKLAVAGKVIGPVFRGNLKRLKVATQALTLIFIVFLGVKAYGGRQPAAYKLPRTPGLSEAAGRYLVTEYIVNGDTIPYSKSHPSRWQEVIFEEWATLSVKSNRPVIIDKSNGEGYYEDDIDRNYELAGIAGRHFYHYDQDTVNHRLLLQNKNSHHRDEVFTLDYQRPADSIITLSGRISPTDSVHITLQRMDKKYLMNEGRRRPVKI